MKSTYAIAFYIKPYSELSIIMSSTLLKYPLVWPPNPDTFPGLINLVLSTDADTRASVF